MRCPRFVTLLTFTLSLHHTSVTAVTHRAYYLTRERPSVVLEGVYQVLDGHLAGRAQVACGRLTIADFQLASMASHWRESEMPLQDFPNIVRWIDGLMRLPARADPWPAKGVNGQRHKSAVRYENRLRGEACMNPGL
jgi:glutathione S-transferase